MKFSDGFWLNRNGYSVNYAVQPVRFQIEQHAVHVFAASQHIYNRGMTLGGVILEIIYSSVKKDSIRVQILHHKGFDNHEPQFALNADADFVPEISETAEAIILRSGKTAVKIAKGDSWNVEFSYDGKHLTGCGWRSASYIQENAFLTECKQHMAQDAPFWEAPVPAHAAYVREQLTLSVGEYIYGFGEKFTPFVKNGQTVEIWNADGGTCSEQSYKNVPFYLSSRGYGIFTCQTGHVSYEVASDTVSKVSMTVAGESLTYFVIGGENCADVLRHYTDLTGKPALTPAKSLGLWLSTSFTTNYDEETVTSFLDGMRERRIPLQMFHFDCFWMKAYTWTSFEWDQDMFPDAEGMLNHLKEKYNIGICVWLNPYIAQQSALFDEGMEKGYFLKRKDGSVFQTDMWQSGMAIVDFTNPDACDWFRCGIQKLCGQGVTAIKTDFGERIPTDVVYYDGSDPVAMHNYYSYLYNKVVFEALESCVGKNRAVLFARSATAGCQKFPVHWGGDCSAEYSAMAETLRGGLSLCASGFGFFSHDIGGFEQTASADVYKRWVAFGLMSTHSRLHGSTSYRVPWAYEEDDENQPENACAVLRFFTNLKGRLMPYLWAQANETHETGIPMMRAMCIDFSHDQTCLTLDRQYMLGESLLCAPVMQESGEVEFYLPAGEWFDLLGRIDAPLTCGERWIRRKCSYLEMPVYVRQNSIIVLGAFRDNVEYDYLEQAEVLICGLMEGCSAEAKIYNTESEVVCTISAVRTGNRIEVNYPAGSYTFTIRIAGSSLCASADSSGVTVLHLS
ncbi:MAG: alpha-xylosidase [Oscillospiraceae bacterium]|nr:alpha-xylosidase [Oscillospiraceae bacterium]